MRALVATLCRKILILTAIYRYIVYGAPRYQIAPSPLPPFETLSAPSLFAARSSNTRIALAYYRTLVRTRPLFIIAPRISVLDDSTIAPILGGASTLRERTVDRVET